MKIAEIETMILQLITNSDELRMALHILLNLLNEQYPIINNSRYAGLLDN